MVDYLSTQEIANKLGITRRMVQKIIRDGKIHAIKTGRDYRIHHEDLEQYLVNVEKGSGAMYYPLNQYLSGVSERKITLSLEEMERIIGKNLPVSAKKYLAWFGNDITPVQAQSWLNAGWKVNEVKLGESVSFVRH
ncbi:MAG: hypothetical protein K0R55_1954 [Sporomusa sp.]|nr:hypothetical protein [Sporomusa sp.]